MIDAAGGSRLPVAFHVCDMSCGRSAGRVTAAVLALDNSAVVRVDLPMRRIQIESCRAEPRDLKDAIGKAGFMPVRQWRR
jgi:copper chaperone CopZ